MSELFMTPMKPLTSPVSLEGLNTGLGVEKKEGGSLFKDVFQNAIQDVISTDQNLTNQEYLLSTGQIDDAHTVPIAAAEAQLSIDLLVQLRNKALEAFNEINRISV